MSISTPSGTPGPDPSPPPEDEDGRSLRTVWWRPDPTPRRQMEEVPVVGARVREALHGSRADPSGLRIDLKAHFALCFEIRTGTLEHISSSTWR